MNDGSIESSLEGMTAKRAVFKLAEVLAVARRGHSWVWIAEWLRERGVKSQRRKPGESGALSVDALSNYFAQAKKQGLVDEARVERLVKELDERLRAETLKSVGTGEALNLLVRIAAESQSDDAASSSRPEPETAASEHLQLPSAAPAEPRPSPSRLITQPPRKVGDPEPFDALREMVIKNLAMPKGEQSEFFQWSGRRLKLNSARQILIKQGVINSFEELSEH